MRLKHFALIAASVLASFVTRQSTAETLTLLSVGGQNAGGVYVYPYNFSVNGSAKTTSLMCIDLNREVTIGESWNVTTQGISNSVSDAAFREDAWLFSQFGNIDPQTHAAYTNAEIQFAAWDVLDASGISANAAYASAFDSPSSYLVNQAMAAASNNSLYTSGFFNNFTVYAPTSNTAGWTDGMPQRFIGKSAAVTPEPSGLLLFGTGLLGAAALVARRKTTATAAC